MTFRRGATLALASMLLVILSTRAYADDASDDAPDDAPDGAPAPSPPPPSRARRVLAAGAAIVPGILVHGAGHWVAGDRKTAKRLLVLEGIGLGLAAAAGLPLGISGGAEETLPALPLLVPATGHLLTTVIADAWGAAGGARITGTPAPTQALDAGAGYTFLGDPRVPFANLATADATAWFGPLRAGASGWLGHGTWQARASFGVRLYGPRVGVASTDVTTIDVIVAGAEEHRRDEGLRIATLEGGATARIDLARIGPSLRGTFATLGAGVGVERIRFMANAVADNSSLFTGRIGWGFVLGDGRARALETELYYDHRRDTLAGGLTIPVPSNGFVGYLGAVTTAWRGRYGLSARLDVGSAYVFTLSARTRLPELP
jgi:hypothetical protein